MNRLRELRKNNNMTLSDMSKQLKEKMGFSISPDAIAKYERGSREPKLDTWETLSDFFNVNITYAQGISNIKNRNYFKYGDDFIMNKVISPLDDKNSLINNKRADEIPNLFIEQDFIHYKELSDLFLHNLELSSYEAEKYQKIFNKIGSKGMKDIQNIYFYMSKLFYILLDSKANDKEAINVKNQLLKIIDKYTND